jgi:hypothetical protein
MRLELEAIPGQEGCDFCTSPEIKWQYMAADFSSSQVSWWESIGAWAACAPCSDLIEASKWDELADRCLHEFTIRRGSPVKYKSLERELLLNIHRDFAAARIGDRVPT